LGFDEIGDGKRVRARLLLEHFKGRERAYLFYEVKNDAELS
jgi:hypothetical protein